MKNILIPGFYFCKHKNQLWVIAKIMQMKIRSTKIKQIYFTLNNFLINLHIVESQFMQCEPKRPTFPTTLCSYLYALPSH